MKYIPVWFSLIFILLLPWSHEVDARVYYINYSTGNDTTGDGTVGTPYKTCTPIENTNALTGGDIVYLAKGSVFKGADAHCAVDSDGASGNPIIFDAYGEGANPQFNGAVAQADIAGWSGWTSVDVNVYESNVSIGFSSWGVIVDEGLYGLGVNYYAPTYGTDRGWVTDFSKFARQRYVQQNSGTGVIRVRLKDDSNPNSHTFEFIQYPTSETYRGLVRTGGSNGSGSRGNYVTFKNIDVYGSRQVGFSSANQYVRFEDCSSKFTGRESFYFLSQDATAPGADWNTCLRCYGAWTNLKPNWNGSSSTGWGQNFTTESSYTDYDSITAEYGFMAGVDFLDYSASTHANYGRLLNSTIRFNSQRSLQSIDAGGFDPQVYLDGGNNIQIINNSIHGNAFSDETYFPTASQNNAAGLTVSTEHAEKIPHDFLIVDNLVYGNRGYAFTTGTLHGEDTVYNVNVYGNTFHGAYINSLAVSDLDTTKTNTFNFYNNIVRTANSSPLIALSSSTIPGYYGNYNLWWNSGNEINYNGLTMSFADAQTTSCSNGKCIEQNSVSADPQFVNCDNGNFNCIKNTLAGDATTSPAVDAGLANADNNYLLMFPIGYTRKDGVIDIEASRDIGYHQGATYLYSKGWWDTPIPPTTFISIKGATLNGFNSN